LLHPFEVSSDYLGEHLEELVDVTFSDLESEFLVMPRGSSFIEYSDFQRAYEVLKRHTAGFRVLTERVVWDALSQDGLSFVVLRTILGMTPPEWSVLARSERGIEVPQGYARNLDTVCRRKRDWFATLKRPRHAKALDRIEALVSVAVQFISQGPASVGKDVLHRLDKIDTSGGLASVEYVAAQHVPYAVVLYERYLGRPFAGHRDSVSELVGDTLESGIEDCLARARISFRKTKRAERVPGYEQAPDFFVPDEYNPAVLIEAKFASDDGTARDKVARIKALAEMREKSIREGGASFQLVVCLGGRGFGVRREDMKQLLLRTDGKVFTLATLDRLVEHTKLRSFLPSSGTSG
jgi:hypothetical protein